MARAIDLAPVLRDLQRQGLSLRGIAAELTKRKVQVTAVPRRAQHLFEAQCHDRIELRCSMGWIEAKLGFLRRRRA